MTRRIPSVALPEVRVLPAPPVVITPSQKETLKLGFCQTCGTPTDQKKFCSQACFRLQRERAEWPSDEKLKELVWAKPATALAEELGVSSVAVKKRCNHRGIETPPRGYWAKLAVGKV